MKFFARSYDFSQSEPTVVIGEIGVNHNGDPALAERLVDVAIDAGVDVVKFQVFNSEKEISRFASLAPYQEQNASDFTSQLELCKALELPASAIRQLKKYCNGHGIGFLCSAFDFDSVDLLTGELNVEAIKIASGEITNLPFLEYIGVRKVGVILSTGGSTLDEIEQAISALRRGGCPELVLLHCISSYPAPNSELNLRAMQSLTREFGVPVGFSDHSLGLKAAIVATELGAVAIEKHFTLDRKMDGPDHAASLEPEDLRALVDQVKRTGKGITGLAPWADEFLGDGVKRAMPSELPNLPLIRKSLVAAKPLRKGERLARADIEIKRPATGIAPGELMNVVGRILAQDLQPDEPINWSSLAES